MRNPFSSFCPSLLFAVAILAASCPAGWAAAAVEGNSKSAPVAANAPDAKPDSSADSNPDSDGLPNAPEPQSTPAPAKAPDNTQSGSPKQTKRILYIVPNFRSVTADQKLPPMSVKDKFKLVLDDTFDYSGFIEVGILAGLSDLHKGEPEFGHGAVAYGRYYWHGLADATGGNIMTEFVVPVAAHEDPRYYTLGHGGFVKRSVYSVSRLLITRTDGGNPTPNLAEIVGNGAASGIANLYYPSPERTWTKTGQRWVLQVGVDGLSNLAKEFWPDVNAKLFHDKF